MSKSKFTVSERMKAICSEVIPGRAAADIGTDHGIVPMFLLTSGMVPYCILSDVNKGPILKAKENLSIAGIDEANYRLRLGDGLKVLAPGDAATVIIAGMGGELIRDIILAAEEVAQSVERFVLQPRSKSSVLRRCLVENGYAIVNERLVREVDRICTVMTVEHRDRTLLPAEAFPSELDYYVPPKLVENRDPLLKEFLLKKKYSAQLILDGIEGQHSPEKDEKRSFWTRRVQQMDQLLQTIDF